MFNLSVGNIFRVSFPNSFFFLKLGFEYSLPPLLFHLLWSLEKAGSYFSKTICILNKDVWAKMFLSTSTCCSNPHLMFCTFTSIPHWKIPNSWNCRIKWYLIWQIFCWYDIWILTDCFKKIIKNLVWALKPFFVLCPEFRRKG